MQLLAIRTKPDERVVDIHLIITPLWLWASVLKGKILEHLRGSKKIIYKMRSKKKTRKKQGHRQELTRVLIEDITII